MTAPAEPPAARLMLEDGTIYHGIGIGAPGTTFGELVFNTSVTGYQEVLTDPSYRGQVVLMTTPEMGNYGVNLEDYESEKIHAAGFVIKRLSPTPSSWRAQHTLNDFLLRWGIVGIQGVDTRAITRRIRTAGAMKAGITSETISDAEFLAKLKAQPGLADQDLVGLVTTPRESRLGFIGQPGAMPILKRITVVDFGAKESIIYYLRHFAQEVVVLPASSTFEDITATQPDGVVLSNGPGDPAILDGPIAMAKALIASAIPTFGICLGHQILALASGARVSKMPFGHHGGNHPVKDLETGQITITSQNHGYAVEFDAFPEDTLKVTHVNLNDGTIEGFRHRHVPVYSVQFHPEASPGPHDTQYLFARFAQEIVALGEAQPA